MPYITLADGVFDPLHEGHLLYLDRCRQFGDAVVVQVSKQTKRRELLPQDTRQQIVAQLGYEAVAYPTTADALAGISPFRYVKGADWRADGIPPEEAAICANLNIHVVYLDDPLLNSSTALLQSWADRTARDGLADFERLAAAQQQIPFNAAAQGYTYENRRAIEGDHPRILAGLCQGKSVLDYGCGPGHFVQLLNAAGANAFGWDANPLYGYVLHPEYVDRADVVVCREVLEHVPAREIGAVMGHLFRIARERVYITTRFTAAPRHPFDLTTEFDADPSHITLLPQSFIRALCVVHGGIRDREWETALDWQHKGRVLVYRVTP